MQRGLEPSKRATMHTGGTKADSNRVITKEALCVIQRREERIKGRGERARSQWAAVEMPPNSVLSVCV